MTDHLLASYVETRTAKKLFTLCWLIISVKLTLC